MATTASSRRTAPTAPGDDDDSDANDDDDGDGDDDGNDLDHKLLQQCCSPLLVWLLQLTTPGDDYHTRVCKMGDIGKKNDDGDAKLW